MVLPPGHSGLWLTPGTEHCAGPATTVTKAMPWAPPPFILPQPFPVQREEISIQARALCVFCGFHCLLLIQVWSKANLPSFLFCCHSDDSAKIKWDIRIKK